MDEGQFGEEALTSPKTGNSVAPPPPLTTWQWLGVIAVIIGGMIGIDQRMQSTVRVFADSNIADHMRIRNEISELSKSLPPAWLTDKVEENRQRMMKVADDIAAIRLSLAQLHGANTDL